jgi:hypothetical protein
MAKRGSLHGMQGKFQHQNLMKSHSGQNPCLGIFRPDEFQGDPIKPANKRGVMSIYVSRVKVEK